ncbi:LysR family transcriptional regulator [Pelagibius sp. CAU 1746]|uniref:LysR family transcriptional regulator n=1 Tax=Pelagibius sp. CAU 1746 TaxID=3140370 RepID=UPI00325C2FEA
MEIKWLEDFLSLVDTRNFSRSAEERFTTQPAFSRRIKGLEEWLGATLFDRSKHPIALTPAGEQFRPIAEEVLRRLLQGREDVRQTSENIESVIVFSATHSLSLTFFPSWIKRIEEGAGVLRTRLDSNQVANCVQALLRGECHFMLCHTHPLVEVSLSDEFFTSLKVGEDRLLPVSAPAPEGGPVHALPGCRELPVSYLAYSDTSAIGRAVELVMAGRPQKPVLNRVFESHLAGVLKTMCQEGRGLAWLPESQIEDAMNAGKLVLAGEESWGIPVDIRLFRSVDPLPRAAEEFWALLPGDAERASD